MRDRTAKFFSLTSVAFLLLFLWCLPVKAALEPAGHVILANGPFIAIQTNASARSLSRGSEFYQGDRLWTGPRTRAQIRFSDGAIMTLRPDTEFSVDEYQFDEKNADNNTGFFTLIKGGFRTLTGLISKLRPDGYRVKTAYAIVGVRGTTYEVVDQSALYVAAWEGTISVTNNKSEMLLGFGQDFNYATVTSINSAPKGTVEIPPPLQQPPDPGLQQAMVDPTETRLVTSLADDGIDPRLTPAEIASLTEVGFATTNTATGTNTTYSGAASDGSTGSPIFLTTNNDVLRQGGPLSVFPGVSPPNDQNPNTPAFASTISWGAWDGGSLQPNPGDASEVTAIPQTFWITMQPATNIPTTGTFNYGPGGFGGVGTDSAVGSVSVANFFGAVNFGTGGINGNMAVQDGAATKTWTMSFAGNVSGGTFSASANGTITGGITADGNIAGAFSGTAAQSMGGVFHFNETGNSSNFVNGAFAASQ
jgi:FecR protein/C-lobe and N-lobe beta barrels of Tf-binding protein B